MHLRVVRGGSGEPTGAGGGPVHGAHRGSPALSAVAGADQRDNDEDRARIDVLSQEKRNYRRDDQDDD